MLNEKQIPLRIFQATDSKQRVIMVVNPGKSEYDTKTLRHQTTGEVLLQIENGLVKTKNPAVINAIYNRPDVRNLFVSPIYKVVNKVIEVKNGKPVITGYEKQPNEIFLNDEHEKAVKESIKKGHYEYVQQEDLDSALADAKQEEKKLELIALKKKNEVNRKALENENPAKEKPLTAAEKKKIAEENQK